ncbi:UNC93-like protein MFSD11 isoform X2 [Condylostylus longicornis]|uniref:UNC93-like protein MFSD11 isoform X2 n=1 Tax=Condylostylus longicornis TaxID=2530218 RepID=UPI00244DD4BD|nr:UNC93-like protein MFSD11 isoform X2 [Condylostylus longicornis]
MDKKFANILILGFGFMFLFTSFQTMGNIQKTVLDSIKSEGFEADGYTSLAIVYTAFSLCNWLAPSFLSFSGPRGAMLIGGTTYCLFILTFLWPKTWLLYLASGLLGAGASITWTGQGTFLSRCSNTKTISRNSDKDISDESRTLVIGVLIAVAVLGLIFLAALRPIPDNQTSNSELQENKNAIDIAFDALKSAWKLFLTKDMILLSWTFFYTGLELSFFSGVYGSSIGFTEKIAEKPKQIVGLAGIFIGLGEVIGGGLFGLLGSKTTKYGRDPIVIMGFIIHAISFFLIFMNLPNDAPFTNTENVGYINPPLAWLALVAAFMLGFGDACFNTQIYSMLGGVFVRSSVEAFALFKFTQSVAAAISFYYSSHLGLHAQLSILLVFSIIGTGCFCIVEWANKRRLKQIKTEQEEYDDDNNLSNNRSKINHDDSTSSNS